MAVNLPNNPANGDSVVLNGTTYVYNSTNNSWDIPVGAGLTLPLTSLSVGAEGTPSGDGAISYDNTTGIFTYTPPVISGGSGITAYANTTDLPTSEVTTGAMAYVSANNKLYIWNGSAWFNIAIVNQAPTAITGNLATYGLATDGTPTVVTLVSTDPEGLPLTWSSSTSGDTQVGTFSLTDNVFTITPSTNEADIGTLSVTFSVTDGNNTETSVSSFTLVFLIPYWNETVLSIGTSSTNGLANRTFIDRSTNAHTVTPTGSPLQTAFHPYLENWSVEFDGNDYFTLSSFPKDTFAGLTNYTLECWVYQSAAQTGDGGALIDCRGNNSSTGWQLRINTNNTLIFYYTTGSSIASTQTIINNQWNHIAVVKTGSSVTLYVNGIGATNASWSAAYVNATSPLRIGGDAGTTYLIGNISNLRIVDNDTIYTANFTPPTENLTAVTGTSLLTCQSNRFIDNSTNAYTITVNGNPKVSAFKPFAQGSEYAVGENKGSSFISPNNYLNIADPTNNFHLNYQEFALEFWVYLTPDNAAGALVSKWASGYSGYRINCTADGTIGFYNVTTTYSVTTKATLNAWTHYACTRDSNGILRQFINGVLQRSDTVNPSNASGSVSMLVGTLHIFPYQGLNVGYISDFRLVKGAPIYTTNFTPPTAPVGNTNASLYLPMDNAGIFDKTGNNTLTPVGNASTSTTQTKYADTAMYFDGTGDYITFLFDEPKSNEDFTIECWFNVSGSARQDIGSSYSASTGIGISLSYDNAYDVMLYNGNNVLLNSSGGLWSENVWNHIAVCRSGTNLNMYVNGVAIGSPITNSTNFTSANPFYLGAAGNNALHLTGYIENFQILKGVAKYTANFTPPNSTQGSTYQKGS
jgi:hypothetical protein